MREKSELLSEIEDLKSKLKLLEEELAETGQARDAARAECGKFKAMLAETENALHSACAEAARWINENAVLWARIHHTTAVLRGELSPPTIAELRKLRGLEPL